MQQVLKSLFGVGSLEEVSRERLETMVSDYPSFGMARYLLSARLKAEQADNFREETQKTNLYFSNPLWLQWLLQNGGPPAQPENLRSARVRPTEVTDLQPQPVHTEPAEPHQPEEEAQPEPQQEIQEEPFQDPIQETQPEPLQEIHSGLPIDYPTLRSNSPEEESRTSEDYPTLRDLPEENAGTTGTTQSVPASPEIPAPAPQPEQAVTQVPDEFPVFQSYHTIDYFASQGIKFNPDENPSDRLGKQLKSFTEWLKVMRKIPQKQQEAETPDPVAETQIRHIAADSIESREVLTETMAEVLAKQGMYDKASEVYHKLSLLNPRKRAYFAEKIEQLKIN